MKRLLIAALFTTTCLLPLAARAEDPGAGSDAQSTPQKDAPQKDGGDFSIEQPAPQKDGGEFGIEAAPEKKAPPPTYTNEISVGGAYVSDRSARFGRYTGLSDQGPYAVGSFLLRGRDEWNSGGTRYWDFEGANLGLDSRSISGAYGDQGLWGAKFSYDGIPYFSSHSFQSIYDDSHSGSLNGAPPSNAPWFNSASLAGFLSERDVETQRDSFAGKAFYQGIPDWTFTGMVRHEHKDGTIEQSMIFGTGKNAVIQGVTPTAASGDIVAFRQPIDYETNQYDLTALYSGKRLQAQITYTYSQFDDNLNSYNAIDPFQSPDTTGAHNGNSLGPVGTFIQSAYSLPPSNSAHQIKGQLGYTIAPETRLYANFTYGLMLQNDSYPADTYNTFIINKGLINHQDSLNGAVQDFFGNLTFTTRPLDDLDVRLSYTIDNHDNLTDPQRVQSFYVDSFRTYADEIGVGAAAGVPNFIYSTDVQTANAQAGYRILPQTKLTVGYTFKDTTRKASDVDHNQEHTFSGRVNSYLFCGMNGMVSIDHSIRAVDSYTEINPWTFLGFAADQNRRGQMSFHEAARIRDDLKGRLSLPQWDQVQVDLTGRVVRENYPRSWFGLIDDYSILAGPDISYMPTKDITASFYYTYQTIFRDLRGGYTTAAPAQPEIWRERTNDDLHTVGIRGDWQATDKLKIGSGFNMSYGNVSYLVEDQLSANQVPTLGNQNYVIQPLPDLVANLYSFNLTGEYQVVPQASIWAGYTFERFSINDFGLNASANPLQYGNAFLSGENSPSYGIHMVSTGVRYRF